MRWIKDEEFIRGNIPMTKFEARILTIALLEIEKGDKLIDIGAGTGSISIEAALQGAEVVSIEREDEGVELIERNCWKFNTSIEIIKGYAPEAMKNINGFNKCFIGGSGGRLKDIFRAVDEKLSSDGIVCGNFVTMKNLEEFTGLLKEYSYKDIETRLVQASKVEDKTGILRANNPIFIVRGRKA